MQTILFTDLDGTLLDAHTYSPDVARPAHARLQRQGIPVVFCSAKTRAEQLPLREGLAVTDPFIVENGSAIIVPPLPLPIPSNFITHADGNHTLTLGLPLAQITTLLDDIRAETGVNFTRFTQLPTTDVMALTGLDEGAAKLAQTRDYSDTLVIPTSAEADAVRAACHARGLKAPSGGKFVTVTGNGADKGQAVRVMTEIYRQHYGDITTVGIGDSPNDAPMLAAVDRPFLVKRPDGTWRDVNVPNLTRLEAVGPVGFVTMVAMIG